jgi:hypothetical protein
MTAMRSIESREVELLGGPLDGLVQPVPVDSDGIAMIAEGSAYLGGRSLYEPLPDQADDDRWHWICDLP